MQEPLTILLTDQARYWHDASDYLSHANVWVQETVNNASN